MDEFSLFHFVDPWNPSRLVVRRRKSQGLHDVLAYSDHKYSSNTFSKL